MLSDGDLLRMKMSNFQILKAVPIAIAFACQNIYRNTKKVAISELVKKKIMKGMISKTLPILLGRIKTIFEVLCAIYLRILKYN